MEETYLEVPVLDEWRRTLKNLSYLCRLFDEFSQVGGMNPHCRKDFQ